MGIINKLSIGILTIVILSSVFAPLISPYDPLKIDLDSIKQPPSFKHPFGTDNKGRDILSRVIYGGRVSLCVAAVAGILSLAIGLFVGLLAGYYGGRLDMGIMAIVDLILAFPSLLLAIGISVIFPPGIYTVMIAIASVGWASFARVIRGYVLTIREMSFIEAAISIGCSDIRIILKHLLPQCVSLCLVFLGLRLGGYILTESALSFLGLGAQPPEPTWGSMISHNRVYISSASWMVFFPGLAIAITTVSLNIIGDLLRDKFDVRLKA